MQREKWTRDPSGIAALDGAHIHILQNSFLNGAIKKDHSGMIPCPGKVSKEPLPFDPTRIAPGYRKARLDFNSKSGISPGY